MIELISHRNVALEPSPPIRTSQPLSILSLDAPGAESSDIWKRLSWSSFEKSTLRVLGFEAGHWVPWRALRVASASSTVSYWNRRNKPSSLEIKLQFPIYKCRHKEKHYWPWRGNGFLFYQSRTRQTSASQFDSVASEKYKKLHWEYWSLCTQDRKTNSDTGWRW